MAPPLPMLTDAQAFSPSMMLEHCSSNAINERDQRTYEDFLACLSMMLTFVNARRGGSKIA